jgi:CRISPR-associated protein Csb1
MNVADALDAIRDARFLLIDVELEPVGAPTLQPTTFANTGASFFVARDGHLAAVVDSVASMANQLELTIWDEATERPLEAVEPLPYIEVRTADDELYTTSRRAAHRLNAASLVNGALEPEGETFESVLKRELGSPRPPLTPALADAVWRYDPLGLVHGCWFPWIWEGRARLTRALSARIDALDVETQTVQVGGQKTADALVEVSVKQRGAEGDTVFGEVPHYTSEVSARRVAGPLLLDVGLLSSYRLGEAPERALIAVAVLQMRELIDAWPRRRSRCVLDVAHYEVRRPQQWELPPRAELRAACRELCAAATGQERAKPRIVRYKPKQQAASK